MKKFSFIDADSRSENGYWIVVIAAKRVDQAIKILKAHLREMGKDTEELDLRNYSVGEIVNNSIIYSSVQP